MLKQDPNDPHEGVPAVPAPEVAATEVAAAEVAVPVAPEDAVPIVPAAEVAAAEVAAAKAAAAEAAEGLREAAAQATAATRPETKAPEALVAAAAARTAATKAAAAAQVAAAAQAAAAASQVAAAAAQAAAAALIAREASAAAASEAATALEAAQKKFIIQLSEQFAGEISLNRSLLHVLFVNSKVSAEAREEPLYKDLERLWCIKKEPLYKFALEEWEQRGEFLFQRQARNESRRVAIQNQVYNIIGWNILFQGVVVTAVSQMSLASSQSTPLCGKVWMPIILTGFASLVTIFGVSKSLLKIGKVKDRIDSTQHSQQVFEDRAGRLRRDGIEKFSFKESTRSVKIKRWNPEFVSLILGLIAFTGLFILSHFVILCDTWVVRKWDGGLHGR